MKYLLTMLITFNTFACDWSSIIKSDSGFFAYPPECHNEVGKALNERKLLRQENQELKKAIEFKDLALNEANVRAEDFRKVMIENNERLHSITERSQLKDILTFTGGTILGIVLVKTAAEVIK